MFGTRRSDSLFKKLTRLARRIKKKRELLDCREFGKHLALLRAMSPKRIYGKRVLATILDGLELETDLKFTLDDGQAFIRLARKLDDKDAMKLAELSVPKAIKLMTLRSKRDLHRLAKRAIAGQWTSRRLIREIVGAQGYRRLDRRAKTDLTKGPKTELSVAGHPTKHLQAILQSPRLAIRDLVRLTRTVEKTLAAWLTKPKNQSPTILSQFRLRFSPQNNPLLSKAEINDLRVALEAVGKTARRLQGIATRIDVKLTAADRSNSMANG